MMIDGVEPLTLRTMAGMFRVWARCAACEWEAEVSVEQLAQACGWETPSHRIRERLRCTRCGARGRDVGVSLVFSADPAKTGRESTSHDGEGDRCRVNAGASSP